MQMSLVSASGVVFKSNRHELAGAQGNGLGQARTGLALSSCRFLLLNAVPFVYH
jgi:hypothetical protein